MGASPDYKDRRGLTPLYHTVLTGGDTSCCETLLYHRGQLGIRDENGWDETPGRYVRSHSHPRRLAFSWDFSQLHCVALEGNSTVWEHVIYFN